MTFREGQVIRFKGPAAEERREELERELGVARCERIERRAVRLLQPVKLQPTTIQPA